MIPTRIREQANTRSLSRCEWCGGVGGELHHRRPRGMGGGDPDMHRIENIVRLCHGCHERATFSPSWAKRNGLVVPHRDRHLILSETPLRLLGRIWVTLTPAGAYRFGRVPLRHLGEVTSLIDAMATEWVRPPDTASAFEPAVVPPRIRLEHRPADPRLQRLFLPVGAAGVETRPFVGSSEDRAHFPPNQFDEVQTLNGVWNVVDPVQDEP